MKKVFYIAALAICSSVLLSPTMASAQAAGGSVIGVSTEVMADVIAGWSAKRSILGKNVYNDDAKPAVVGEVVDIIISPKGSVSYAIVNASKFLGLSNHRVAIPVEQFKFDSNRIILSGATKDALRALPVFQYAEKK
ncbi:PRC-barrel domain-containing protein [Diaphorobacter aerolatus]|uniref:PRC-barrel domain-containing protein n=1 Tax=Diaphorobacter aerolatus TaxID=1288495 RepID=A0A7H0GQM6_9BURK|nr:PRC-barrel domain-containing protein [Diaphorobacter aerolatus]QNP50592.1 PRC-barrel domain-containing protein [Diaphorobacter aerolatus]